MYKILDLVLNIVVGVYTTQFEVLDAWAAKCSPVFGMLDFSQLNITGRDTYKKDAWKYRPCNFDSSWWGVVSRDVTKLKRFQVIGAAGHPVDIRLWTNVAKEFESLYWKVPRTDYRKAGTLLPWLSLLEESPRSGKKGCFRKAKDPAMYRQSLALDAIELGEAALQQLAHPNRRNASNVRKSVWQTSFSEASHSWKDQGRSCRQWGKQDRIRRRNLRNKRISRSSDRDAWDDLDACASNRAIEVPMA